MFEFFYDNSLAVVLALSLGGVLLGLALSRKRPAPRPSDAYRTLARDAMTRNPNITFEKIKAERDPSVENIFGKRPVRKEPALAASYTPPTRKPTVVLTPRQIERVNIVRKQQGRAPFNRTGLKNAVSSAWDTPRREPATTNDWLTYLILYDIFFADHQSRHCAGAGGITIDPNQPYNGGGGEFAGAGASGDWTSAPPSVASIAGGIAVGASAGYIATHLEDTNLNDYRPGDTVGGYRAPAPDPIADGDLPSGAAMSRFLNDKPDDRRSYEERQADAVVDTYQRGPAPFDEKPAPSNPPDSPRSAPTDTGGGTGSSPVSDSTPSYTSSPDSSSSGDSGGGGGGGGDGS